MNSLRFAGKRKEFSLRNGVNSIRWISWKREFPASTESVNELTSKYLVNILNSQVYKVAVETPLTFAPSLSTELDNEIYLKREDTQPVFSFKIRGAYNKIASLNQEQLSKGVVTCSAGNHAQGVALSSSRSGINATIVMPEATPQIKVKAVKRFGGKTVKVLLHGQNYDEAAAEAKRLAGTGLTMVHPFDDSFVIAGQGTIGMEILKNLNGRQLDAIFVCCGGGGMLAGIAAYIKAVRPEVKVIGVEAEDAAGMTSSLQEGKVVTLPTVGLFADGAAVRTVGAETFRVCRDLVDEMVTVGTDEICSAIKTGFNDTRCVMEPAGALAIAGVTKYVSENKITGKTFVAITSGANMDFDRLRFVSERADSSETILSVTISEEPGSFRKFYKVFHPRNVTEFSYRFNSSKVANIIMSYQAPTGTVVETDKLEMIEKLRLNGYGVTDLSGNELAKVHVRHLGGGRKPLVSGDELGLLENCEELIYRFEFPEAPGALDKFLHTLNHFNNKNWSISLFHYRNHGDDFGRVLVGLLVKTEDKKEFNDFLHKLGYKYYDETHNSAYLQFIK